MAENDNLALEDVEAIIQADTTQPSFITDLDKQLIKYKLANYEIVLPNNETYNTQLEQARFALEKAKLQYKKTQEYYNKRMAELDKQETALKMKEKDLQNKTAETMHIKNMYITQSDEIAAQNRKNEQVKQEQLRMLADVIDTNAAAQAILQILEEREKQYQIYSKTILDIYNDLAGQNIQYSDSDSFENVKNVSEAQFYIKSIFTKLNKEQQQTMQLDRVMQKQYQDVQSEIDRKQKSLKLEMSQFDNELQDMTKQVELQKNRKQQYEDEINQLNILLSTKTVDLSEAFTDITNLCAKVTFSQRQINAVNQMSIEQLVGNNQNLKAAVDDYRKKCKNTVTVEEAHQRILGEQVIDKLKSLAMLSMWIQDNESLIAICKEEQQKKQQGQGKSTLKK